MAERFFTMAAGFRRASISAKEADLARAWSRALCVPMKGRLPSTATCRMGVSLWPCGRTGASRRARR